MTGRDNLVSLVMYTLRVHSSCCCIIMTKAHFEGFLFELSLLIVIIWLRLLLEGKRGLCHHWEISSLPPFLMHSCVGNTRDGKSRCTKLNKRMIKRKRRFCMRSWQKEERKEQKAWHERKNFRNETRDWWENKKRFAMKGLRITKSNRRTLLTEKRIDKRRDLCLLKVSLKKRKKMRREKDERVLWCLWENYTHVFFALQFSFLNRKRRTKTLILMSLLAYEEDSNWIPAKKDQAVWTEWGNWKGISLCSKCSETRFECRILWLNDFLCQIVFPKV